jgi:photosystem II Psb28-2 protein
MGFSSRFYHETVSTGQFSALNLNGVEYQFEIEREDHWERFIGFMNPYAEANGMAYGESNKS